MAKRANGEGTIYQRKDDRWACAVSMGRDPITGKVIRKFLYGKTQEEVKEKLRQLRNEVAEGAYITEKDTTVGQWLNLWATDYCTHVKPRTLASYRNIIKSRLKPAFGVVPLGKLQSHHIQRFINSLELAPKTVSNIYMVLNKALNQAVELGYLKRNPCGPVKLPKKVKPEIRVLTDEEMKRLLEAIDGHEYENFYKLALLTSLRRAELLGLTWDCFKEDTGTLRVYRQLQILDGSYTFTTPKSGKPRSVSLPPAVVKLLKAIRLEQKEMKLKAGRAWSNKEGFIFTNGLGGHYSYYNVAHAFRRLVSDIGLDGVSLHDLRHTYAVNALRAGDNVKNVQGNLGHATPAFTLDRYATITSDMMKESANKMQAFIEGLGLKI